MRNYDKLLQLYGKDRATGKSSDVPVSLRVTVAHNVRKRKMSPSSMTIGDIDQMMSDNACNLESFEGCEVEPDCDDAPTPDTPTSQAQSETQVSRTKRSKQNPKNDALEILKSRLQDIAKAIFDLSDKPSVSASKLW